MKYEDVEKKEDGSRVMVTVSINIDSFSTREYYYISVMKCEPRKRTWRDVVDSNNYSYRKMDMTERRLFAKDKHIEIAGIEQINRALIGAWEEIKPELYKGTTK